MYIYICITSQNIVEHHEHLHTIAKKAVDICKTPQNVKESCETCASAQTRISQTLRRGRVNKLRNCC